MFMETINKIELTDKAVYPDEAVLRKVLGRSYSAYCALLELFGRNGMNHEWRYYNDGKAWLCKVQMKKRTIIWMSAWKGYMQVTVYIPEKYLERLYALPVSDETRQKIRATRNVGRSKPCIFEIRNQKVLNDLDKVIQFRIRAK